MVSGAEMNFKSLVLASTLLALVCTPVSATLVTETFSGTITSSTSTPTAPYAAAAIGTPFTISYTFDDAATPTDISPPSGLTILSYPVSSFTAQLGTIFSFTATTNAFIYVEDFFGLQSYSADGFTDDSISPFLSASVNLNVPSSPFSPVPDLSELSSSTASFAACPTTFQCDGNFFTAVGAFTVSSAVPEPSTWAMLLIGIAGIGFMLYRKRGTLALA